jgi:hypothetical protein
LLFHYKFKNFYNPEHFSNNSKIVAVYVDASTACNTLAFQLGQTGIGTTIPTRSWSLKVFQNMWVLRNGGVR